MLAKDGAILGVHPKVFSPTSVQFKSEINDAFPRKRHQKRHLEFCTAHLRSRVSGVRISPGAPSPLISIDLNELEKLRFTPTKLRKEQTGFSESKDLSCFKKAHGGT